MEQRRYTEVTKNIRKQDRRIKEITFDSEEDKKTIQRLQGDIDGLQNKCKTYKRQVEEAVSFIYIYFHLLPFWTSK